MSPSNLPSFTSHDSKLMRLLLQLKLPNSVGQKKTKALEQVLEELGVDLNPTPTDAIVTNYNELRQDIVLLYELKLALANCEYELQTQKHRLQTLAPDRVSGIFFLVFHDVGYGPMCGNFSVRNSVSTFSVLFAQ